MNNPMVLGISGHKRCGKDEVYQAIAKHFKDVHRIAFGDFVKEELCEACGVSRQFLDEHKEEFRLGMQWWGTEFRRGLFNDQYWINRARERFEEIKTQGARIVVFTDCRFPNEIGLIKELGGQTWLVLRDRDVPKDFHASETSLDGFKFDRCLQNVGSLGQFHDEVRGAFYEDFVMRQPLEVPL